MNSSWRALFDWLWKFISKLLIVVEAVKNSPTRPDNILRKEIDTNDPEMAVGHETMITESPVKDTETLLKNEKSANGISLSEEGVYAYTVGADSEIIEQGSGFETESLNMDVDVLNNKRSADQFCAEVNVISRQESNGLMNINDVNSDSVNSANIRSFDNEVESNELEDENFMDSELAITSNLPGENDGAAGVEYSGDANYVENILSENSTIETVFTNSSDSEYISSDNSNLETSVNGFVETTSSSAHNVETAPSEVSGIRAVSHEDRTNYINEDDACGYYENDYSNATDELKVSWLLDLSSRTAYHEVLAPQYYNLNFKAADELLMENVHTALKQLRRLTPLLGLGLKRRKKDMWLCLYPEAHVDFPIVEEDQLWNVINTMREQINYMENGCLCTFRIQKSQPCSQCQAHVASTEASSASSLSCETMSVYASELNKATHEEIPLIDCIVSPTSSRTGNMHTIETCDERIPNAFHSNVTVSKMVTGFPEDNSEQLDTALVPSQSPHCDIFRNGLSNGICSSENEVSADTIVNNTSVSSRSFVMDCQETKSMSYSYRLIFGIPRLLAGETLAKHICDTFIKELNQVISGTCGDTISCPEINCSNEKNDNQAGLQNNCDAECDTRDNCCELGNNEFSEQSEAVSNSESVDEIDNDAIRIFMKPHITAIESAFISHEKSYDGKENSSSQPNNPEAIDRNSPYIERRLEESHTKNFLNKCKTLRVNFVCSFATCVNFAVANCLVKYGYIMEDQDVNIGHSISVYYSFEDLSEYEWQDNDNRNESNGDEVQRIDCCKPATVTLNSKPCNLQTGFWERVQLVHKNRLAMVGASSNTFPLKIPLGMDSEVKEEDFAPICHPSANISIASIQNQDEVYHIRMDHVESTSFQELSPIIIFLRTNNITLTLSENCVRFTYYNQGQFVPHQFAHDFADDILSVLKKSITV